jgi:hypothetical protein
VLIWAVAWKGRRVSTIARTVTAFRRVEGLGRSPIRASRGGIQTGRCLGVQKEGEGEGITDFVGMTGACNVHNKSLSSRDARRCQTERRVGKTAMADVGGQRTACRKAR